MNTRAPDETIRLPLCGSRVLLGRDESCTVRLSGIGVSRRHAEIVCDAGACTVTDLHSTFGTRLNGQPIDRASLADGDILTIGVLDFKITLHGPELLLVPITREQQDIDDAAGVSPAPEVITIGRDPSATLVLAHPLVSRLHATASRQADGTYLIKDHQSTNGTYINGRMIRQAVASEGDIIQIGPYRLFVEQGRLTRADGANRIRLEAFSVTVRSRTKLLLDRVSLELPAGEFVAVLGPSGAGKSTLARVLCGRQEVSGGRVFANRLPLKAFLGAFRANIGYVAQENCLHPELTVAETFHEQCLLRLPRDSSPFERQSRIDEVVALLELDAVKHQRIAALSGGEAKRVHLGVELLASPACIVLDEPLAGLDPALVRKFMHLFRRICDKGHSVILTTHTLERIEYCDRLVVMHRGRVVFNGPPSALSATFGSTDLAEVYERTTLGRLRDEVAAESAPRDGRTAPLPAAMVTFKYRKPRSLSRARQWLLFMRRYLIIMTRDRRTLLLMLLQAPLIAFFLALVFRTDSSFLPLSFYFCVTISAIWITGLNASQEIAREWRLLDRDYRAGLSLIAYLGAKMSVTMLSATIQGTLFWLSLGLSFAHFPMTGVTLLLSLTGAAGGGVLGLCISACSATVGRATTLLPIVFIPQIFFSGILIPFDRMSEVGRVLSYCTMSRPVFGLYKHACLLERPIFASDAWTPLFILSAAIIILLSVAVHFRCAKG